MFYTFLPFFSGGRKIFCTMSDLDMILSLSQLHSKTTPSADSGEALLNALNEIYHHNRELESRLDAKERRIAELIQENNSLKNELERYKTLAKNNTTAFLDIPGHDGDKSPSTLPRKSKKPHPIDNDTIARLKNSHDYVVVCDKALFYWQKLVDAELITAQLMRTPRCGVTTAARIVCRFQTVVDNSIKWSFFQRRWRIDHLQSNLVRSAYKDEKYYPIVNTIFGLAPDAPFISKRNQAF